MSHKKVLMTVTTSALVASAFVGTEEAKAASHEVEQGDTLWAIAQEHDISVQDLRKWNELKSDLIFPGQILQLAGPKEDKSSTQEVETNQSDDTTYIVKSGDTLSHIALSYNVSIADLMAWNNLQSTLIFPGNVLLVKDDVTQTESIDYTVRAGDTLSQIALKHGVTVAQLAKWNNITNPNLILINQKLTIHLPTEEKVEETTQPEVEEEVTQPEAEVEEETTEPEAEVEEEVTEPEAELEEETTEPEAEVEEETTEPEAEVKEEVTEPEAKLEEEVTEPEAEVEEETTEPEAEVEEETAEPEAELEEETTEPEAEVEEESTEPEAEVKEDKAEPETEIKEEAKEVTVAPANNNETVYKVVAGDSLSKIAREFGMSAKAVADRNGIETSKVLHINDELIVNKKKEQAAPKPQAQAKPETKPETQAQPETKPETKPEVKPKPQVKPKPEAKPQPKPQAQSSGFDVNRLMSSARSAIGTPYVWGASNPGKAFDCSGFIHWAYNDAGKQMSRTSTDGYYARSYHINKSDLQVGDLVFFKGTYRAGISHMGIYAGNNNFIHAGSSTGVTVTSLDNSYWKKHFDSFKRFN